MHRIQFIVSKIVPKHVAKDHNQWYTWLNYIDKNNLIQEMSSVTEVCEVSLQGAMGELKQQQQQHVWTQDIWAGVTAACVVACLPAFVGHLPEF